MALLGRAALLLSFDVVSGVVPEHDDWHTHEHLPERLSIPGFLRGTRWIALREEPRYLVVYEVATLTTLTSTPYLERLNHPTPWTAKLMAFYRGMRRGLCEVSGSIGLGLGHLMLLVRITPQSSAAASLSKQLLGDVLPRFASRAGIGSLHLLEEAAPAPMTNEQRIRGVDAAVGWAILASGYSEEALTDLAQTELSRSRLEHLGAGDVVHGMYRLDYALSCDEVRNDGHRAR